LVAADRSAFIAAAKGDIVVLDIPLLFEIGADNLCNGVIVVTAPPEVQKARVLARGLSEDAFNALLARQMPDKEKQRRATWVVQTTTLEDVRRALQDIVLQIKKGISHA
jgi:dephospho-CoA kinase